MMEVKNATQLRKSVSVHFFVPADAADEQQAHRGGRGRMGDGVAPERTAEGHNGPVESRWRPGYCRQARSTIEGSKRAQRRCRLHTRERSTR